MKKSFMQVLFFISCFFWTLYNYLDNFNDLTRLRLEVPKSLLELDQRRITYQQLKDQWMRLCSLNALYTLKQQPGFCHLRCYRIPQALPNSAIASALEDIPTKTPLEKSDPLILIPGANDSNEPLSPHA